MGDDKQAITAEQVSDYLVQHADFFIEQPDVLESLQLASSPAGTISLAQRQTERLQNKNHQLQEQLHALIDNARQNNALQTRVHQLCLKLMDAGSIDELLPLLVNELKLEFKADEVAIRLFYSGDHVPLLPDTTENIVQLHADDSALKVVDGILAKQRPVCGRFSKDQKKLLFDTQAEQVQSVACLPIGHSPCAGLLAIASFDANRFHADMGTDYLSFLGEVIMRLLRPFTHNHGE
ncbi:MAG: DUF484 family protein [Gammaproteobacteria bacterium]|nr:DUF484 family protein [Gammaproteobacteria bacterium]